MRSVRIQAVDHVNIEAPLGIQDALRWFYGEVALLDELPGDGEELCICFTSDQIELRIRLVEKPKIVAVATRVTLAVPSLDDAACKLDDSSIPYERTTGITWTDRRLSTQDPAGNRVEFKTIARYRPL